MQKNKNKFIYFIIISIFLILSAGIYISVFFKSVDRNSYLELVSGEGFLNEKVLEIGKREKLSKEDIIETNTKYSLAIIEWGDGSITRLGGNTKIEIKEQFVSKNKNNVNILFNLFSGKTWSNVLSYMGEDSYFKQVFSDTEVAVRGTIYTVDLENNYLYVEEHKIDIKNEEIGKLEVKENKQIELSDFKFISLDDFIRYFKDKGFFEWNKKLDKEYFLKLSLDLQKNINNLVSLSSKKIDDLTKEQREEVYKDFLEKYQELNFISSKYSEELFDLKIKIKEKLIELTPESGKERILNTLNYDLKDIFQNKNFGSFEKITDILKENTQYIDYNDLLEYFRIFNVKFEIGETIEKSIDTFNQNVTNNPKYRKFFDSVSNEISNTFNEQKNIFMKMIEWVKNLFN